jgi:flagellum-specific peptidoglycan hydrolase FlgJ
MKVHYLLFSALCFMSALVINKEHTTTKETLTDICTVSDTVQVSKSKQKSKYFDSQKVARIDAFCDRFLNVAKTEQIKYGIPASIKLAQAILESGIGESKLATKNNNFFGIKCFAKKCEKNHCSNYHDDTHKDFFRNYETAWESFRAHSILLQKNRYIHLQSHETDYRSWAEGLQSAGYATDPKYSEKLISLIEDYELYKYDK